MEGNFKHNIGENRKLGYSAEFKKMVINNPEILKDFLLLSDKLETIGQKETKNNLDLELFYIANNKKKNKYRYFHAKINGEGDYFVKTGTPYREAEDTENAKKLLENMRGVRVVDFDLAYEKKDGLSFFVSKWENLPTLEDYYWGQDIGSRVDLDKDIKLRRRLDEVEDILGIKYFDISDKNCFYDKKKDELVFFDLVTIDPKEISKGKENYAAKKIKE